MSNAIAFLETMGQDASLAHAERGTLVVALSDAGIDLPMQEAILEMNQARIETLLGASHNVFCGFFPEKREEEEEDDEPKDDDEIRLQQSMYDFA